jgi:type II restriction/modification system DNA methylase subunit YeeA
VPQYSKSVLFEFNSLDDIYEHIGEGRMFSRDEANTIVNSLKICDPAVGSGHFLVSALNEMIAVKNDLKILQDREGKRLKEYQFEVENDELIITDEEGELFEYHPTNKESQRVQETLFHEKQTIIENCLFGVDINPNSVKICRLRLWIELLKNAYYKNATELETLPNIDINIKCGNSLISRFAIDADLSQALKKSKWNIDSYKRAVDTYRNAENKEQKREMERLIVDIKSDFRSEISQNDPKLQKLRKLSGELYNMTNQVQLFERSEKEKAEWNKQVEKINTEIQKLEAEIADIKANKIYDNAFEWRFEFPDVLDEDGNFIGFDVVIGNPPYFSLSTLENEMQNYLVNSNFKTFTKGSDIYCLFYELGMNILNDKSIICYITSNRFCFTNYGIDLRKYLSEKNILQIINFNEVNVFENANVGSLIMLVAKNTPNEREIQLLDFKETSLLKPIEKLMIEKSKMLCKDYFSENQWSFDENIIQRIKLKIESKGISFSKWNGIATNRGVTTGANKIFIIDTITKDKICNEDPNSIEIIKPILRGRDIKRYNLTWSGDWIIFTKRGVDIENYPAIKSYLLPFRNELEPGIGRKVGKYKWFEIQDITAFYTEFDKKKLIWTRLSNINGFSISENKEFCLDSASFAVTNDAEYLSAILNSKVVLFYFKLGSVIWGKDGIKWFGNYFDNIPIPAITKEEQEPFIKIVDQILDLKKENPSHDTSALEAEIDKMVYALYGLTEEEVKIVEGR